MKEGICYIVGAGECNRLLLHPQNDDMVIAVDGGYEPLKEQRIDLVVGDFDSLSYVPTHPNVIQLPPEKDDTDMMIAIKEGLRAGYRCFRIYGGTGGRLSHTVANFQCLAYLLEKGARGYLIDAREVTTMIHNDSMEFPATYKGYLSVFSYEKEAKGVTIKGLKYPLDNAVLTSRVPLGVSNEFISGVPSCVSVKEGTLLLIYENQESLSF